LSRPKRSPGPHSFAIRGRRSDIYVGNAHAVVSSRPRAITQQPEQRGEFGSCKRRQKMAREKVLFGYIVDPDTRKIVAVIRHGEVF
jgi:hypothetical protein